MGEHASPIALCVGFFMFFIVIFSTDPAELAAAAALSCTADTPVTQRASIFWPRGGGGKDAGGAEDEERKSEEGLSKFSAGGTRRTWNPLQPRHAWFLFLLTATACIKSPPLCWGVAAISSLHGHGCRFQKGTLSHQNVSNTGTREAQCCSCHARPLVGGVFARVCRKTIWIEVVIDVRMRRE